MARENIIVQGDKELIRKLGKLKNGVTVIVRAATSKATTPVNKSVKRVTPVGVGTVQPGLLKKSIGKATRTYRSSGTVVGLVGVRTGFAVTVDGKKADPARYGAIVNKRTGFLSTTFISQRSKIVATLHREIGRGIDRQAKKRA